MEWIAQKCRQNVAGQTPQGFGVCAAVWVKLKLVVIGGKRKNDALFTHLSYKTYTIIYQMTPILLFLAIGISCIQTRIINFLVEFQAGSSYSLAFARFKAEIRDVVVIVCRILNFE